MRRQLQLLTWLALVLLAGAGAVEQTRNAIGRRLLQSSRFTRPYTVCTSDWAPIVTCAGIDDPADYDGYQIALWREIAKDLGWQASDWTFKCMDWSEMIDDLVSDNGNCSLAAAGVEVSLTNILLGLKFSWPIYKSGFQVLIASAVEEGGTWAFAQAFHWSVWAVLGATAIIASFLITLIEMMTYGIQANRKGFRGWSWYCMGMVVQVPAHVGDPKTWASRILVLGYAFLVLIMVHLFTATTANKMTMQRLANDITSKADLPGKKVESWEPYLPLLRKYSIDAEALPWDNDDDTAVMLNNLRTHKYQALILDSPVVRHFAAQAEGCDLYPVGDPFETFNLAIAFPPMAPDALASSVSASIVRLQTNHALLDELDNYFVKGEGNFRNTFETQTQQKLYCSNTFVDSSSGGHGSDAQIKIKQVAGVWYILLFTCVAAAALTLLARLRLLLCKMAVHPEHQHRNCVIADSANGSDQAGPDKLQAGPDKRTDLDSANGGSQAGPDKCQGVYEDCITEITLPGMFSGKSPDKPPSWQAAVSKQQRQGRCRVCKAADLVY